LPTMEELGFKAEEPIPVPEPTFSPRDDEDDHNAFADTLHF